MFFHLMETMNTVKKTIQYKCFNNIKPIDVVKVRFADFKKYYKIYNAIIW